MRIALLGLALAGGLAATGAVAAPTLTGSYAAWSAAVGRSVTSTPATGLFDPFALTLPTTASVPLGDGQVLGLSNTAQVTQPQNGFPYLLSDGFGGDLLIPVDALGNQVKSETITPRSGSLSALGFEIVPFSSVVGGPYTVAVTLAGGQVLSATAPGGSFNTGTTTPEFFGFYGGPVASLTITTSDPNGFAFGNFVDVPEPGSTVLLLTGMVGLACLTRRKAW